MKKQTVFLSKKPIIILTMKAVFFLVTSCMEESFNPNLTEEFTLLSTTNGATYKLKVALPDYYDSSKKYGTIYVLDGEENFDFVANRCREISNEHAVENVIVVSIGYGLDRSIDYTPTQVGSGTGGAPQFLEFIRDQLVPEMEQRYAVDTTRNGRTILGHSYGGLFGAYVFAVDNTLFGNYLLLSPSLWYDNEITMRLEKDNRENNKERQQLMFMGIGEMENSGRMQAPFEAFYQILSKNYPNIRIARNQEKHLGHMGSKDPNIVLGLNHYFENRYAK
jgi:uncharacterized protein